jgi:hypothetical protein
VPEFTVGRGGAQANPPRVIDFTRVTILGNAGRRLNDLSDVLLSPEVGTPSVPHPIEKKVLTDIGLAPTREAKAALDFFMGGSRAANPAGADRRPQPLDALRYGLTPEQLAARLQRAPLPVVLPMWEADP